MFPDLIQWGWCLLTPLFFWFATGLSHIRVTGILHSPAAGESRYLSKGYLSPLTGLLYISMMSCFTPCSVGWAQGDGFAQCRFKSNPIREHLHTQKNNTHKEQIRAAASSGFGCRIRAIFCSWCTYTGYSYGKKQKHMLPQWWGKPAAMATFRNNVNRKILTETSLVIQPSFPTQCMCSLYPLPFASLPRWCWKSLLVLWGSLLFHALAGGL